MFRETCNNQECMKEFNVTMMGVDVPGGKDKEPVICPYCNTIVRTEMISQTFSTSKLEDLKK